MPFSNGCCRAVKAAKDRVKGLLDEENVYSQKNQMHHSMFILQFLLKIFASYRNFMPCSGFIIASWTLQKYKHFIMTKS